MGGRVVLLYDEDPNWHRDLNRTISKLESKDFSEDFKDPVDKEQDVLYNTRDKF